MSALRSWLVAAELVLAIGLVAPQLACVAGTNRIVRTAVPAGIEATLHTLDDSKNREIFLRLVDDPAVRSAARKLAAAVTRGALDGATDAEQARELEALSESYVRTVSATLAEMLDEEISPAATRSVQHIVGGAIDSAVGSKQERLTSSFIDGVTRTAIVALMQSTSHGMQDDLGPALAAVIRNDLGPALGAVIRDDLQPALHELLDTEAKVAMGGLVRQITKDAVLGANDGMSELGMSLSPNEEDSIGLLGWVAVLLGLIVAVLLAWLVHTILRHRALEQDRLQLEQDRARSEQDRVRSEQDRARSERTLLTILRTLQSAEDPSHPPDLDTLIARARMQNDPDPTHELWWNEMLARARARESAHPRPAAFGLPPTT